LLAIKEQTIDATALPMIEIRLIIPIHLLSLAFGKQGKPCRMPAVGDDRFITLYRLYSIISKKYLQSSGVAFLIGAIAVDIFNTILIILGSGAFAAAVSGFVQLKLWRMNRKAALDDKKSGKNDVMKESLCLLMRDRIHHLAEKYIHDGFVSLNKKTDLLEMYACYHNKLNGNGVRLEFMVKMVETLPVQNNHEPKHKTNFIL
jgi:hypothetical protein